MTINKEQAQARLSAIEDGLRTLNDAAATLRSIIEAPEPVEKKPLVQSKGKLGYAVEWFNDGYGVPGSCAQNSFETRQQAEAYAEAFNTLLDLRRQPGSEAAEDGKDQWFIRGDGELSSYLGLGPKLSEICPPFDSEASALAAREAVGRDRILRMYNTLQGREHE